MFDDIPVEVREDPTPTGTEPIDHEADNQPETWWIEQELHDEAEYARWCEGESLRRGYWGRVA